MQILVIEDDRSVCHTIAAVLETYKASVDCATSLKEAEELLTRKNYDAICLDLFMDGEMSIDIFNRFKDKTVLISGWPAAVQIAEHYNADFLMKPFRIEELEKKVLTIVKKESSH